MDLEEIKKKNDELKTSQATLEKEHEELQIAILKEILKIEEERRGFNYESNYQHKK